MISVTQMDERDERDTITSAERERDSEDARRAADRVTDDATFFGDDDAASNVDSSDNECYSWRTRGYA